MTPAIDDTARGWGRAASRSLTLMRMSLALPLLVLGMRRASGQTIAILLCIGFVSDVYDGVIARRFDVATAGLRRLDSAADSIFYLAAAFCVWRLHPVAIVDNRWLITAVIGSLAANHVLEFLKFGRESSYHAWSAKAWGAALFVALVVLFAGRSDVLVPAALGVGIFSHLENMAITLTLPFWQHDVTTVLHARAIRRASALFPASCPRLNVQDGHEFPEALE